MAHTRRQFLRALGAGAAIPGKRPWFPREPPDVRPGRTTLSSRFPDLRRHFVFEYYPWYGGPPDYVHWDFWNRRPPEDLAATCVPRLGAYDVRDRRLLEQHARWIADSGVGAVALSWWGRGSWEDRTVPLIMDVFGA